MNMRFHHQILKMYPMISEKKLKQEFQRSNFCFYSWYHTWSYRPFLWPLKWNMAIWRFLSHRATPRNIIPFERWDFPVSKNHPVWDSLLTPISQWNAPICWWLNFSPSSLPGALGGSACRGRSMLLARGWDAMGDWKVVNPFYWSLGNNYLIDC